MADRVVNEPLSFGDWVRRRRQVLDKTQAALAHQVGCATITIQKIELDERRPSRQMALRLAEYLKIPSDWQQLFVQCARSERALSQLPDPPYWAIAPPLATINTLPAQTTLFGRRSERIELKARLKDPEIRLVTIVGLGGMGKTHLAISIARELVAEGHFTDGVYFVPLTAITTRAHLVPAIADCLNLSQADSREPETAFLHQLRGKHLLIVLDNFEQLLSEVDFLERILLAAPEVKLFVTSRERLNLREEWLLELRGLSYPDNVNVNEREAASYDSVSLFAQRAQQIWFDFSLASKLKAVVRICRLTQGMPLALELAAGWIRVIPAQDIADQIEHRFSFLSTALRNIPERHRSLYAVFDSSWEWLTEEERSVFSKLSVFQGGFDRLAAENVANASLSILAVLVDKSLLWRTQEDRYEIHELLRQFGADKLIRDPASETATRDTHLDYFANMAVELDQKLMKGDAGKWLDQFEADYANIRAALAWSISGKNRLEAGARLATSLTSFWMARGHSREGRDWLTKAQFYAEAALPMSLQANLWLKAGIMEIFLRHNSAAQPLLESSLLLYQRLEDDHGLAETHLALGRIALRLNHWLGAETHFKQSSQLFRGLSDKRGQADSFSYLGRLAAAKHDWQTARINHEKALALYRKLGGNQDRVATSLRFLGHIVMEIGEMAYAQQLLEGALAIFQDITHRLAVGLVHESLGDLARIGENYERAATHYRQGLITAVDLGLEIPSLWSNLGSARLQMGEYEQASELFHKSLELAQGQGNITVVALSIAGLAGVALFQGNEQLAVSLLGAVASWHEQAGVKMEKADRIDFDRLISRAHVQLLEDAFATAWNEGYSMTLEQAKILAAG